MKKDLMYGSLDSIGQTGDRLAKSPPEEPDASIANVRVCEGGLGGNAQVYSARRKDVAPG